jgi:hypothetical protein
MAISSARAIFGLQAIGTFDVPSTLVTGLESGSVTLGAPQTPVNFSNADVCYSTKITLTSAQNPVLAVTTGDVTADGATVLDGDGKDFQGDDITTIVTLYGVCVELVTGAVSISDGTNTFPAPCQFWFDSGSTTTELLGNLTLTGTGASSSVIITVIGKSS